MGRGYYSEKIHYYRERYTTVHTKDSNSIGIQYFESIMFIVNDFSNHYISHNIHHADILQKMQLAINFHKKSR